MDDLKPVFIIIFIFVGISFGINACTEYTKGEFKCTQWERIEEVLEISYRDGKILLSNGKIVSVGQSGPHRVGGKYCAKMYWVKE